ncbi:inverse autotransporter beta domain-containing protein [Xenorhabdus bovienii]|uniref:inverse autotransporter beta domain-containing protein n=1 Tax=Xenorhabdus bovienii TaxID=40576 RepID=UPI00237CB6E4|nr:inverse autotransporter beta domain-containing protein [Xenorhabdus bovienii]MDE1483618.1 inverse autotransporter beta domain-containing protein [Xenorhabdus bovienii]MDE9442856.1 inverse autotransporter beta domain-containing protein [Xenorhabdus bovienii]
MDSYIRYKSVRTFAFISSLLLLLTSTSALAAEKQTPEHAAPKKFLQHKEPENNADNIENDKIGMFAEHIQTAADVLSSSPSELAEQAKSYALGKLKNTVSTEAQKWLSQFGTAKINFSLDRKGKLDNSSLDLLLPFYDNKADWLFFTQLGYRNKDSRNTLNLGLGGRYFTPDWMYGVNTFFDHDITGKNKRLGLGGEAWTDYVKLSANTYWRLSDWQQSPNEKIYEERPANGFDLNGEFFLPAYPNLGGKLSYEQYFGDNVALFNRDTKQKNPSLARFGLNYTPIPLVTMGVDYKSGSGGRSETLFLANLNYRFGVPFSVQLSPDNVASMRTLAGSRYDLVERNNHIVLDYKKKTELQISLKDINGYSGQQQEVPAKVVSDSPSQVTWRVGDGNGFKDNGGQLPLHGNPIAITLPKYIYKGKNSYPIYARVQDDSSGQSKEAEMHVTVVPFIVKDTKITSDSESAYTLAATLTYGKDSDPALPAGTVIDDVKWTVEPPDDAMTLNWDKSGKTNDKGQLTATITSTKAKKGKVYLEMNGMPKVEIGSVNFSGSGEPEPKPKTEIKSLIVKPETPISVNDPNGVFTFVATVVDAEGVPLRNQKINPKWRLVRDNKNLTLEEGSDSTDGNGQLTATLRNKTHQPAEDQVGLLIEGADEKLSNSVVFTSEGEQPVSIQSVTVDPVGILEATGTDKDKYTFTAKVVDAKGWPYANQPVDPNWKSNIYPAPAGMKVEPLSQSTDQDGLIKATVTSTQAVWKARMELTIKGGSHVFSTDTFSFLAADIDDLDKVTLGELEIDYKGQPATSGQSIPGDGQEYYTYKVLVKNSVSQKGMPNQSLAGVTWKAETDASELPEKLVLQPDTDATTDEQGYLTAKLRSGVGLDDVKITVKVTSKNNKDDQNVTAKYPVSFTAEEIKSNIEVFSDSINSPMPRKRMHDDGLDNIFEKALVRLIGDDDNPIDHYQQVVNYDNPDGFVHINRKGEISVPYNKLADINKPFYITANVVDRKTKAKYTYTYKFHLKRFIFTPNLVSKYVLFTDPPATGSSAEKNSSCLTLEYKYSFWYSNRELVRVKDYLGEDDDAKNSLVNEYGRDIEAWGIVPKDPNGLLWLKGGESGGYEAYDYHTDSIGTIDGVGHGRQYHGRMFCQIGLPAINAPTNGN